MKDPVTEPHPHMAVLYIRMAALILTGVAFIPATAWTAPDEAQSPTEATYTNRLIDSNNPYLLLHAHNPVDWFPWGPEAFAKARADNKPIFLSVGYSTCFWCHVAERTLYSDPQVAALMNAWFVNVKVDREQLPDVDTLYMLARQLLSGPGGWPNNVFLTPELKPFYAGSYFPPEGDALGRPGFPAILRGLHEAWSTRNHEVLTVAERVFQRIEAVQAQLAARGEHVAIAPRTWLAEARSAYLRSFDAERGGHAGGRSRTKFPMSPMLEMLLLDYRLHGDGELLRAITRTLDAMAYGGIHDHLGGGFHRYSTDPQWSVPHFEKMLYDNAQLLEVYATAYELTGRPLYRLIAEDIAEYLTGHMMAPAGGFYTAEDAQVDGVEGVTNRWHREEIERVLGSKAAQRFFRVYELVTVPEIRGATGTGDFGGVLRARLPIEATLERTGARTLTSMLAELDPQRRALLAVRDTRPQPLRDEKLNMDLNGLAIRALATAGGILERPDYIESAELAGERLWRKAYAANTGRLMHQIFRDRAQTEGYLSDYAHFGRALLSLYRATGNPRWRERASTLADALLERFLKADGALVMSTGPTELPVRIESTGDNAYPSGPSAAIDLLLDLARTSGEARYAAAARRVLDRYGPRVAELPSMWASTVTAVNAAGTAESVAGTADVIATADYRGPLQTADRVRVTAPAIGAPDETNINVVLHVDEGFHVNANPASFDFLIPTTVAFKGVAPQRIEYPEPEEFVAGFAGGESLGVYSGEIAVVATFLHGTFAQQSSIEGIVTAQACNQELCLPPSEFPVRIEVSAPGRASAIQEKPADRR